MNASIESEAFRSALGAFCSGVTVITACDDEGNRYGMTCQSFFSVSLDPPLVGFSPARSSTSYPDIRRCGSFAVNVLSHDQHALAAQFARRGVDKWAGVTATPGVAGSPIIEGALAAIECDITAEYEAGDHYIVLGLVKALAHDPERHPLLFFRSAFTGLHGRPPVTVAG